jgi:ribosomal 50S subunit-recycling heat shock protein
MVIKIWIKIMRLDKWLKVSRVIKRRTVANEACDKDKIKINNRIAKASAEVKPGDTLEITLGNSQRVIEIVKVPAAGNVTTQAARELYTVISETRSSDDDFD